jgi:phosphatidate cytidylyltransferase
LVVGSILLGPLFFAGIFLVFGIAGLYEFFRITEKENVKPQKLEGIICATVLYSTFILVNNDIISKVWLLINILTFTLLFVNELYRNREKPFFSIALTLTGIIYIVVPLIFLNLLFDKGNTANSFNPHLLLSFFIILWTSDTFAYLSGMAFGKHKLFERISPKKTWEGSIGGGIAGIIAAGILSFFFKEYSIATWFIIALTVIVFGTLGDLAESLLKRSCNVKDSGNILPGHGGILDRIDGVLIAAPVLYVFINLIK